MIINNNFKYNAIYQHIKNFNKISLFTHLDPDGDTIASAVGLKALILANFTNKIVKIIGDAFPLNLKFLGQTDLVNDQFIKDSLAIIIDTSTARRIHDQRYLLSSNRIKIDHHNDEGGNWLVNISGDFYAATGEIITDFALENKLIINSTAAIALFTSIYSDTELFSHRQINEKTWERIHLLKIKGADPIEIEKQYASPPEARAFLEYIKRNKIISGNTAYILINEALVARFKPDLSIFKAYVRELKTDRVAKWSLILQMPDCIRIGIRSDETKNIGLLAKEFGGGGHKTSAGTKVMSWNIVEAFLEKLKAL